MIACKQEINIKNNRSCPVCASVKCESLGNQKFAIPKGHPLPQEYNIVSCRRCGFVYADTPAIQENYNKYYREFSKYEDLKISSGGGINKWDLIRLRDATGFISRFLKNKSRSILDIGCANGGLLSELKKRGYSNLYGIDPSPKCVSNVNKLGIKASRGDIFSVTKNVKERKFGCIILSHVLEHICDLNLAINNTASILDKDGMLYIEVPDAANYSECHVVPYYYFDCEHINHFDIAALDNLLLSKGFERLGFREKRLRFINKFYPVISAVYLKNPVSSVRAVSPDFRTKNIVKRYIAESMKKNTYPQISKLIKGRQEIVVWGAGSFTLRLMENNKLAQCNIKCFVDNDAKKYGSSINNIPICPPLEILNNFRGPILICSALYSKEIVIQIKRMGLDNEIVVLN